MSISLTAAAQSALATFRNSSEATGFIVFTYSDPNTLDVSATGTGALVEAASHFPRSNAAYALLRSNHVIDRSVTTKFAYVDWTCENTPPTRKAVLSTHKPQARHLLQPFHVDLVATDNSDIQDGQSVIDRKIAAASGTAINERSMAEATQAGAYFKAGAGAGSVKKGGASAADAALPASVATRTDGNSLVLNDDASIRQAIKDVRSDNCDKNWLLISYDSTGRALELVGAGSNGVDEMAASLDDKRAMYGLFSTTAQFDRSTTTKHGFVKFIGPQMPVMRKAQLAPHAGFIHALFEPYHLDLAIDSRDELSAAIAAERIRTLMFTAESKAGQHQSGGATSNTSVAQANKFRPAAAASSSAQFTDEAYVAALTQVHQTNGPISWLLGAAVSPDRLQLLATGSEDDINAAVAAATSKFESNRANFALFRLIDMIDGHATTKFVYVACVPAAVPAMTKARLATVQQAISAAHRPWHVEFFVESSSDITGDDVVKKVGAASGSKNFSK